MVKVTKIAAWKIEGEFFEDAKLAEAMARRIILKEMMQAKAVVLDSYADIAVWVSDNWEEIENRVKKAMAGSS